MTVSPGHWTFEKLTGVILDDGATFEAGVRVWGNGSASDTLAFTISAHDDDDSVTGGSAIQSIEVRNVAPTIANLELSYELNAQGFVVSASVGGSFADPGGYDFHRVNIVWGSAGSKEETLQLGARAFSISRSFDPAAEIEEQDLFTLTATVFDDDGGNDFVEVERPTVDLDASTIDHNQSTGLLDELVEESEGAWVPTNVDDDDYDATNSSDRQQIGAWPFSLETDLLPIVLHKVEPASAGGKYTLTIPDNVRVWQKRIGEDAVDRVLSTTEFDATVETTLYVEGIATGSAMIKVNWTDGMMTLTDADRIKVTVFPWLGPLNVPGFSRYTYRAWGKEGAGNSRWIAATHGSLLEDSSYPISRFSDHIAEIQWTEGPVVGKAVFQAAPQYVWDWEVNVVEVKIQPSSPSAIIFGNPAQQDTGSPVIRSFTGIAPAGAMSATLAVERIEGPTRGGVRRGAKFIEIGFIQNIKVTAMHGDYYFDPNDPDDNIRRKHESENGQWYLDAAPGGTLPWYDSAGVTGGTGFFAPSSDDLLTLPTIPIFQVFDTPFAPGTDRWVTPGNLADDAVDRFEIIMDFNLFFAARTKDDRNGANQRFAQRASAAWKFDGSGTISANQQWTVFTWNNGAPPDASGAGQNNTGDSTFTIITSGLGVPIVTGPVANDAFNSMHFIEIPWL